MTIVKATQTALSDTLADQWLEFFYCDALDSNTLMERCYNRVSDRGSNTRGDSGVITDGSKIVVNEGQAMIVIDEGKILSVFKEPGEYRFRSDNSKGIFTSGLNSIAKDTWRRIGYGGEAPQASQRVYCINTLEMVGNYIASEKPIPFNIVVRKLGISMTVSLVFKGVYSYRVTNPEVLYKRLMGNVSGFYSAGKLGQQMRSEILKVIQAALGKYGAEHEVFPDQLPAMITSLYEFVLEQLNDWLHENRGVQIVKLAFSSFTLTDKDNHTIMDLQKALCYSDPEMAAALRTMVTAEAMEAAAGNSGGAAAGMMGMAGAMILSGGFSQQNGAPKPTLKAEWTCTCGMENTGKFCRECGARRPDWVCVCGSVNPDGKFCRECGAARL